MIGAGAEADLAAEIGAQCPGVINLVGRTDFAQVAALAARAAVVVGNDTGPTHLAAAAGAPTVVLFSKASDPALCAPRGPQVVVVRRPHLADLEVDDVMQAVKTLRPS